LQGADLHVQSQRLTLPPDQPCHARTLDDVPPSYLRLTGGALAPLTCLNEVQDNESFQPATLGGVYFTVRRSLKSFMRLVGVRNPIPGL
jgi:hypothetical protein